MQQICPKCGVEYDKTASECDWCPGTNLVPNDKAPHTRSSRQEKITSMSLKARRWDALHMAAHRFGVQIRPVIQYIERIIR